MRSRPWVIVMVAAAMAAATLPDALASVPARSEAACASGGTALLFGGEDDLQVVDGPTDRFGTRVSFGLTTSRCGPVEVVARTGGASERLTLTNPGDSPETLEKGLDPCAGGSDLPGTVVEVAGSGDGVQLGGTVVLGPDEAKPKFLDPNSSPRENSPVEVGEEIGFEFTATDKNARDVTWQTGVHTLEVTGPRGLIERERAGRRPKPCDRKSESLTVAGSYRVRESDPAVIELCAVARDYDPGASHQSTKCLQFYKGEVWKGTIDGTGVNTGRPGEVCPDPSTHSGDFTIVIESDGKATLTGHLVNTSVCVGGFTTEADFALDGRKSRSQIAFAPAATFPFEVNLRIRDDHASGTSTASPGDFYTVTLSFSADCKTCRGGND